MKIFVNSYTYAYDRHLRMFDYFSRKEALIFILPKVWKARGGKIVVVPTQRTGFKMFFARAPFYHSNYPIIRGLLKGWIPSTGSFLKKLGSPGDVLLASSEPNLLTSYLYGKLCKKLRIKVVFLTWQNIPYEKRLNGLKLKITEWLLRKNIEMAAGVLCGTKQAYEINKPYFREGTRAEIIPQSGVDVEIFKPDVESNFRDTYNLRGKIIFLFGAVFDERKGVFTTIQAFAQVAKKLPEGHLVMIGIGKLWSRAKEMVTQLDIADRVTFIEWLPNSELPGIFSAVDIFVHPSEPYKDWEEQYGWVLLQASASSLPIIATRIGAIPEAVLDGVTGVLIPPKDPEALAAAMTGLALDPDKRRSMGESGRRYILDNLSHQKVAERLEKFLYSL